MSGYEVGSFAHQNLEELQGIVEAVSGDDLEALTRAVDSAARIVLHGSGRSLLMAKAVAMRLMHIGLDVTVAGEVLTPALRQGDLLVAVSARLGDSARRAIDLARNVDAHVAVITASRQGVDARDISVLLVVPARTEVPSAQHAGSLFEQSVLVLGDAVSRAIQGARGVPTSDLDARHANL